MIKGPLSALFWGKHLISTNVHVRVQLKLGAKLSKRKRRIFPIHFGGNFWKEFCDFCEKFTCVTLFIGAQSE